MPPTYGQFLYSLKYWQGIDDKDMREDIRPSRMVFDVHALQSAVEGRQLIPASRSTRWSVALPCL